MKTETHKRHFKIGDKVYHRDVYEHKEPLKVIGIREHELELEGDYSGGTHNVTQSSWLPVKGVSLIYNHKYKSECREYATDIAKLLKAGTKFDQGAQLEAIAKLTFMVNSLTTDTYLNPEC